MKRVLGIMSVENEEFPPFGKQRFFFENLVEVSTACSFELFFFSPMHWTEGKKIIKGYQYSHSQWQSISKELPAIIYDRAFSKDPGQKLHIDRCRQYLHLLGLKFLNPLNLVEVLNDKVAFHTCLEKYKLPTLSTFPIEIIREERFLNRLNQCRYYIKPQYGSQGEGIFVVEKYNEKYILFDNLGNSKSFSNHSSLLTHLDYLILRGSNYFIQEEAKVVRYEGAPFDIRVVVQNNGTAYNVTGSAIRRGPKNAMTSNLNTGGSALPFEALDGFFIENFNKNAKDLEEEIYDLCLNCSSSLKTDFGHFAEIGFDILITKDKGPIIIEGNAKPSRWVFVKIGDYLEAQGLDPSAFRALRKETVRMPLVYAESIFNDLNNL